MHGNQWEWCLDWSKYEYEDAASVDPKDPDSGGDRIHRGGGWQSGPQTCQSTYRDATRPDTGIELIDFRVLVKPK
jgi:formylglycine-generating enzyme required for sulfatase activity